MAHSLRQRLGALAIDWPRYERAIHGAWERIHNRDERLLVAPQGRGVACQWQWTSDLHVTRVFPRLGIRLMRRALAEWPIAFADSPVEHHDAPDVSFVIGHRGHERVPQLLATLGTLAAQQGVGCECVVVEQSVKPEVRERLPAWVRYVHTPLPVVDLPYCRSWALNVGARIATGRLVVFHDNDMLVPERYALELWQRHRAGFEVVNLKRFIFYLSQAHSQEIQAARRVTTSRAPEATVQNLEAGGSIAVDRDAFLALGGYDEAFVGWGGEDNEFYERAVTRKTWPFAYLPIVHLWHAPQPRKEDPSNPTARQRAERSALPPQRRIAELAARPFGDPTRLSPASICPQPA